MIRIIILTFFLASQTYIVFAQADYRPGYVVTLDGDTLSGFIRYSSSDSRFEQCLFRTTPEGTSTTYTPDRLIGYRFQNDSYYGSRLVTGADSLKKLHFAEVLVSGKATLLKVYDRFYLEDEKHTIYDLKKVVTEVQNDEGKFMKTNNLYLGILSWQFADCDQAFKKVKNTSLTEKDLTKIFETYNSCFTIQTISFKDLKPWTQIYIGAGGGGMISTLFDLEYVQPQELINRDQFKKDKSLFFSLNSSFSSPRISERLSLNIDLIYQKSSHESLTTYPGQYHVVVFENTSLQLPVGLQYHINHSSLMIKPLLEIGASFTFNLNSESYWQSEYESSGTVVINRTYNIMNARPTAIKSFLGLGALYDLKPGLRLTFRCRYSYGMSKIEDEPFPMREQNISTMGSLLIKL